MVETNWCDIWNNKFKIHDKNAFFLPPYVTTINNQKSMGFRRRQVGLVQASIIAFLVVSHVHAASFCRWIADVSKSPTIMSCDGPTTVNNCEDKELFSVAPMMGHTNRHYRFFFRLLSKRAHLYTEMIPSSQINRAYKRAREIYLKEGAKVNSGSNNIHHPEAILELMYRLSADPAKENSLLPYEDKSVDPLTLHQLLSTSGSEEHPVVLQLGGRDPGTVGAAAAIGSAFGVVSAGSSSYASININCGCPSNAVGGRSGGCSLMKEPDTVARCVEQMNACVTSLHNRITSTVPEGSTSRQSHPPSITVKHRLGVRDAATFDAVADNAKNDNEAIEACSSFVRAVAMSGAVPKFHVHARLGLLGEFVDDDKVGKNYPFKKKQTLWVPEIPSFSVSSPGTNRIKIDHKREQEQARRRARKATVLNRNVPPLRPNVVYRLAEKFPKLEFVTNGGIDRMEDVQRIVGETGSAIQRQNNGVVGAMVGRAVINHPCSFAAADQLWNNISQNSRPTRGEVLEQYIQYCDDEEARVANLAASATQMERLRRRLIAVPFHLFVGEAGSDKFQRRLKKLKDKTQGVKASSILTGALTFVPCETLDKCVDDYTDWQGITQYEGGLQRGSAMQRIVY